jgi:GNAT superfamily N-acetyltransferase
VAADAIIQAMSIPSQVDPGYVWDDHPAWYHLVCLASIVPIACVAGWVMGRLVLTPASGLPADGRWQAGRVQEGGGRLEVVPFRRDLEEDVLRLIVGIQRDEFAIPITAADQPDLRNIPAFYQVGRGNFWVARSGAEVVGTISVLDIGGGRGALRKMFVAAPYRGRAHGTAQRLLDALVEWCSGHSIREIYLGTAPAFRAAHRFYEKNGFTEIPKASLPAAFPVMAVDEKFYHRRLQDTL